MLRSLVPVIAGLALAACGPPFPGHDEADRERLYASLTEITLRDYIDTLQAQVAEVPAMSWGSDTIVTLADQWPVFSFAYTTSGLNLRTGPGTKNSILATIPEGGRVVLQLLGTDRPGHPWGGLSSFINLFSARSPDWTLTWQGALREFTQDGWVRVRFDGQRGWVAAGYLRAPTMVEIDSERFLGLRRGVDEGIERSTSHNVWSWVLRLLPLGIVAEIALYWALGNRRVYLDSRGWPWRTVGGIAFPALIFTSIQMRVGYLTTDQTGNFLLAIVVVVALIGLPAAWLANQLIGRFRIPTASWVRH